MASARSGGRRSTIFFAFGLLAVAVGLGIGVPHAAKTGMSAVAAAGFLALGGGLVLLAVGASGLIRATPRWYRVATVVAVSCVSYAVVFALGQAIAATNVPRTSIGSHTPADVGLAYRDVSFNTADGVTLSGWYTPLSTAR